MVANKVVLRAKQLSVRCACTLSSGTGSALSSNVGHGRHGKMHGREREPHRPAETNVVTERTARMDAAQHVQSLAAQFHTLTRHPTTQAQAQLAGLIDARVWGKPRELDASARGAWNNSELVMLSYIGQLERNLMNAMKNSAASENPVMNMGSDVCSEQDSSSTSHFLLMMTSTGKAMKIVGNAGERDGLEAWRLLVLELHPRAKSRAAGLMQKLLAFELTSDTAAFELFEKVCLGLKQVTDIHIQEEEKWAGNASHAGRHVVAPLDHAREQVGHVVQGLREEVQERLQAV